MIALLSGGDEVAVGAGDAPGKSPVEAATLLAGGKVFYQRSTFHLETKYIGADGRPATNPGDAAYAISRSVPEEMWLAPDGSGRILYGTESAVVPAQPGRRARVARGRRARPGEADGTAGRVGAEEAGLRPRASSTRR